MLYFNNNTTNTNLPITTKNFQNLVSASFLSLQSVYTSTIATTPANINSTTVETPISVMNKNGFFDLTFNSTSISYYVVLLSVGFILFIIGLFGYIDSKYIRSNDKFRIGSIVIITFYMFDLISGIFYYVSLGL